MNSTICTAIRERRLIQLSYHWGHRVVEPHAYGLNENGHELLRVFQTSGASDSGKPAGWKLLRADEITGMRVLEDHFAGARSGYSRGDKALDREIYCEL